jgi:methionine aminopeptidase
MNMDLDCLLKAASIHNEIKKIIIPMLKPNVKLYDISQTISNNIRKKLPEHLNMGIPFPPCISVSHIMAHHCPSKYKEEIATYNDNIKIDYGVHYNGWIIDSAFSYYFNQKYSTQHKATYEALINGIKEMGIDACVCDISQTIQEIIESYEISHNKNIYPLQVVNNLSGHGISQYNIHTKPTIGNKNEFCNMERLKEGIYAIEPFSCILNPNFQYGSQNNVYELKNISININNNALYKRLKNIFGNFSFTDSDLEFYKINPNSDNFKKCVNVLPDFIGTPGDIVCHYEHTIYIDNNKKIDLNII